MARHDPAATATLLEHMAVIDPDRVARWLHHGVVPDRRTADGLRGIVARRIAADDVDAAEAIVAAIEDPVARGRATLAILDRSATLDVQSRREQIAAVEQKARSIDDPSTRVVSLARVAESWLATGDLASARRTLDDAEKIAASLPRAGAGAKAWSALVPVLVKLDPAVAGRRLENLIDPHDADQCRLAMAIRWAPVDPQAAIRMMATIRSSATKLRGIPQVCYLLAPVDRTTALDLARSIATIHPAIHAYSLGMIAAGCRIADRKFARETLGTAFTVLAAHQGTGNPPTLADPVPPSVIAAALLPVVEAVDPTSLPEYFWTAMALHIHGTESPAGSDAMLALLLDRYHPEVARSIFDPTKINPASLAADQLPLVLLSAAQIDPIAAHRWVQDATGAGHWPPLKAEHDDNLLQLIIACTLDAADRRDRAVREYLGLWTLMKPAP